MFKVTALFGIILCFNMIKSEQILRIFRGEVAAGNFTYFTLQRDGEITLILDSTEGDADIYISEHVAKPDFDDYDLQSITCGRDIVTIPKHFKRPIGITVFGHIYSPISKYVMTVVVDYSSQEEKDESDTKEEFSIWKKLISTIRILFDVLEKWLSELI